MTRPLGSLNRISRVLKEGMIQAAIDSDLGHDSEDPNAPPSLNRYLTNFANKHETEFFVALTKLIPKQTLVDTQSTIDRGVTSYSSLQQVREAMLESGMSPKTVAAIESQLPSVNNNEPVYNEPVDISHLMEPENGPDDET
jgi:hypothetical protein